MALTMSEAQERRDRNMVRFPWANPSKEAVDLRMALERAHAELDATRARVAEVERERDTAKANATHVAALLVEQGHALAAREAECAELRAAVDHLLREWLAWRPGITGVARTRAEAALSRPPGSDAALRAMLTRAVKKSWDGALEYATGGQFDSLTDVEAEGIVARLLEPPAEARDGGAR